MPPHHDKTPWQLVDMINSQHIVYDLIYNPSPTLLLQEAAKRGATTIDGLAMLHYQAELSWRLWNL
ncbi:MAG: hypothetical protein KBT04_00310 [Bacteroidales bacterium]|nr:hypothetical protein [Candidatus Colimorpha onthohippi]